MEEKDGYRFCKIKIENTTEVTRPAQLPYGIEHARNKHSKIAIPYFNFY